MFNNIRKNPKQVRQQVAFWYAIGLTSVVAFIWVISLQYRLDSAVIDENAVEKQTGAFSQFLNEARENFANAFSALGTTTEPLQEEGATISEPAATSTQFMLTPRATTTEATSTPRHVRVEPASSNATSSEQ